MTQAKLIPNLEAMAREHTERAINRVQGLIDDPDPKIALAAAKEIFDRGHGKPTQAIVTIPARKEVQAILSAMTDEQLMERIDAATPVAQLDYEEAELDPLLR